MKRMIPTLHGLFQDVMFELGNVKWTQNFEDEISLRGVECNTPHIKNSVSIILSGFI
jgi:hypothetical protein